jgi:hypothetical protein
MPIGTSLALSRRPAPAAVLDLTKRSAKPVRGAGADGSELDEGFVAEGVAGVEIGEIREELGGERRGDVGECRTEEPDRGRERLDVAPAELGGRAGSDEVSNPEEDKDGRGDDAEHDDAVLLGVVDRVLCGPVGDVGDLDVGEGGGGLGG